MAQRSPWDESNREPFIELPALLGWRTRYPDIMFSDPPVLFLQAVPIFPLAHPSPVARGIVWDPFSLIESIRRPGGHQVLTSDCGYAPDSYLNEQIHVSHPNARQIVWELDIKGLGSALEDWLKGTDGFIRLTFERDEYEADVRALLRDLRHCAMHPVSVADLSDTDGIDTLKREYAHLSTLQVDELEPSRRGMALEDLLDLDPDAAWPREPIWPPGTLVEYGFFPVGDRHELIRVNGVPKQLGWPGKDFTRWKALSAFRCWLGLAHRGWTLGRGEYAPALDDERNRFFLLSGEDRAPCHAAGHHLAATVQACCDEGATAPGVTVRYVECPLAVA